MKLFDDMTPIEKIDHIQKRLDSALQEIKINQITRAAEILDVWDYWMPYVLGRLRKLEEVAREARECVYTPIALTADTAVRAWHERNHQYLRTALAALDKQP